MSKTVQLDLPEDLAQEAQANGLLEPERLAKLIAREVGELGGRDFFQTARELRSASGEPMSMEKIQHIVDEVRTERAAREAGH